MFCDAWNDIAWVEGKYGGVYVDIVRIEYFWEDERFQNGCGKITRKRTFIWTVQVVIRAGKQGDI